RAPAALRSPPAKTPAERKPAAAATNPLSTPTNPRRRSSGALSFSREMLRSRRMREIVLLTLGVITPLGILAVNASAFVMMHLDQFRIGIAACPLGSGLVLNGLTAWWLLRLARSTAPPLYPEYRWWAIGIAVVIVLLTAGGGGYLT